MCGISGLFNFDSSEPVDADILQRMSSVMIHRGPDDRGEYLSGRVGLAFNRLSIIDLSGGHQPMSNQDGSAWIVFNGEIYNFADLRRELESAGHRFRGHCDSEVMLAAFETFGIESALRRFAGMFALGLWDRKQRVLHLIRDRLGKKPLYIALDRDALLGRCVQTAARNDAFNTPGRLAHGRIERATGTDSSLVVPR